MKWISTKRHLKYPSIEAWMEGEHISSLMVPGDPMKQDDLFRQMGELRQKLWQVHLASLTEGEQRMIGESKHPSQSHSCADAAREILNEFKRRYGTLAYISDINLGMYHMDRIVFSVMFNRKTPWQEWQKDIPLFFRGFEIKAGFPEKIEPTTFSILSPQHRGSG